MNANVDGEGGRLLYLAGHQIYGYKCGPQDAPSLRSGRQHVLYLAPAPTRAPSDL